MIDVNRRNSIYRIRALLLIMTLLVIACNPAAIVSKSDTHNSNKATNGTPTKGIHRPTRNFSAHTPVRTAKLLVTLKGSDPLPGCGTRQVAEMVMDFADAFNQGKAQRAAGYFSLVNKNTWYSANTDRSRGKAKTFTTHNKKDLIAYFQRRHQHHERIEPVMISANLHARNGVALQYVLRVKADDLSQRLMIGKGAIDCANHRIFVWSMTPMAKKDPAWPDCPRPRGWKPGDAVIACALA